MKLGTPKQKIMFEEYIKQQRDRHRSEDDVDYEALTRVIKENDDMGLIELMNQIGGNHACDAF